MQKNRLGNFPTRFIIEPFVLAMLTCTRFFSKLNFIKVLF